MHRQVQGEALTGVRVGQPLSHEMLNSRLRACRRSPASKAGKSNHPMRCLSAAACKSSGSSGITLYIMRVVSWKKLDFFGTACLKLGSMGPRLRRLMRVVEHIDQEQEHAASITA